MKKNKTELGEFKGCFKSRDEHKMVIIVTAAVLQQDQSLDGTSRISNQCHSDAT